MAVKEAKKQAGATEEVKAENYTPITEKTDSGANTAATEENKTEEETLRLAYIGPSLPKGQLKSNKIFIGTENEIKKELETVLGEYPTVWRLMVPVGQLAEKKDKVKTTGNILNKYYSDIVSSIAANEAKEG